MIWICPRKQVGMEDPGVCSIMCFLNTWIFSSTGNKKDTVGGDVYPVPKGPTGTYWMLAEDSSHKVVPQFGIAKLVSL